MGLAVVSPVGMLPASSGSPATLPSPPSPLRRLAPALLPLALLAAALVVPCATAEPTGVAVYFQGPWKIQAKVCLYYGEEPGVTVAPDSQGGTFLVQVPFVGPEPEDDDLPGAVPSGVGAGSLYVTEQAECPDETPDSDPGGSAPGIPDGLLPLEAVLTGDLSPRLP